MKDKKKDIAQRKNNYMWQSLALYGGLSLNMGITVAGGYYLGNFLEKKLGWSNMALWGIFIGLFLGLIEFFIIAAKGMGKES